MWRYVASVFLALGCWSMGILVGIAFGGKAAPIPWLGVMAILAAVGLGVLSSRLYGRRRVEYIAGFAVFTIITCLVYPAIQSARAASEQSGCISNIKQLAISLEMYRTDFDERFPLAATWNTATRSYRSEDYRCKLCKAPYSYAMNQAIAGKRLDDPDTVLLFERDGANPNQTGGFESIAYRHSGAAYIALTGGVTKRLPKGNPNRYPWIPASGR